MRIDIIIYDGIDEMDVIGPLEVFRSAASIGADIIARLVTTHHHNEIRGAYGLRFRPDDAHTIGAADVLVVPGGGWNARADVGAWGEHRRGHLPAFLRAAAPHTEILAGVCTGTMILAHAGLVGVRPATTHHDALVELAATGAQVRSARVVDDGDLVTSGGVTSGIDLALWLVHRFDSPERAARVAHRMAHSWTPSDVDHHLHPAPAGPGPG